MTLKKRIFDITFSFLLFLMLVVPIGLISILIFLRQGRPVFYGAERVTSDNKLFLLWKFRTMTVCLGDHGVSGADKSNRITPMGKVLRKYRLDELPQIWNIFKGDMSFVGPRPPLKQYVDEFPQLYRNILKSRPGLTGLATLYFHRHEALILSNCKTAEETNKIYTRRCVPRKARLDLIYQRRQTFFLDLFILGQTFKKVFLGGQHAPK